MSAVALQARRAFSFVSCVVRRTEAEMPGFIKPQLAMLKPKAPKGGQWLHEIKYDGYRVQVHVNRGRKKVYTRNGLDWTKRFSAIAGAFDIRAKPSSTERWSSFTRAVRTFPNCRQS